MRDSVLRLVRTRSAAFLATIALLATLPAAQAQDNASVFSAMKLLPPGKPQALARIVGQEGKPAPDRWYFIAYDETSESGVREYVVAKGELVASRKLSQFAETLRPGDVLGLDGIKIDSTGAAKIASAFAHANNVVISRIDFDLRKEGEEAAPYWKLTCFDDAGKQAGIVMVTAGKGTVISHEGFAIEPPASEMALDSYAGTLSAQTSGTDETASTSGDQKTPTKKRKTRGDDDDDGHHRASHGFRKVGGKLQRFFTGRDTISD